MQAWEYKVVIVHKTVVLTEKELNTLGRKGWELVSHVGVESNMVYTFKRPLVGEEDA